MTTDQAGSVQAAATPVAKTFAVVLINFTNLATQPWTKATVASAVTGAASEPEDLLRGGVEGPDDRRGDGLRLVHDRRDDHGLRLADVAHARLERGDRGRGQPERLHQRDVHLAADERVRLRRRRLRARELHVHQRHAQRPGDGPRGRPQLRARPRERAQLRRGWHAGDDRRGRELHDADLRRPVLDDGQQGPPPQPRARSWASSGWLDASQKVVGTPGNTYTISPYLGTGPVKLVRIPRGDGSFFDLDVRTPYGSFDNFAAGSPAVSGATIRLGWGTASPTGSPQATELLDTTPATTDLKDAPLLVGRSITDPVSTISFATQSIGSGGVIVRVTEGIAPGAPGIAGRDASTAEPSVSLGWNAATDNVAVASYRVTRDGSTVATLPATARAWSDHSVNARLELRLRRRRDRYLRATSGAAATKTVDVPAGGPTPTPTAAPTATPTPAPTRRRRRPRPRPPRRPTPTPPDADPRPTPTPDPTPTPPPDAGAPTAPEPLTGTPTTTTVSLAWGAASDDTGVTGYRITRNGTTVATVGGEAASWKDSIARAADDVRLHGRRARRRRQHERRRRADRDHEGGHQRARPAEAASTSRTATAGGSRSPGRPRATTSASCATGSTAWASAPRSPRPARRHVRFRAKAGREVRRPGVRRGRQPRRRLGADPRPLGAGRRTRAAVAEPAICGAGSIGACRCRPGPSSRCSPCARSRSVSSPCASRRGPADRAASRRTCSRCSRAFGAFYLIGHRLGAVDRARGLAVRVPGRAARRPRDRVRGGAGRGVRAGRRRAREAAIDGRPEAAARLVPDRATPARRLSRPADRRGSSRCTSPRRRAGSGSPAMRTASALWHAVTPLPQYETMSVAQRREPGPQRVGIEEPAVGAEVAAARAG